MASEFSDVGAGINMNSDRRMEPLNTMSGMEPGQETHGSGPHSPSEDPASGSLEFILDVPLQIAVELGRTKMLVNDLLQLGQGAVIELSKNAGETLDIMANRKLIARGEVVVTNEKYGVRLTEIVTPAERIEGLK